MAGEKEPIANFFCFRERRTSFSLKYCMIRPSIVFETRRKVALRGEGFVWVPDLGSFLKLREVGVSPYLGFTLYLSVFQCFSCYEALNGCLMGPKTWDRIDTIFLSHGVARNCFRGCLVIKS